MLTTVIPVILFILIYYIAIILIQISGRTVDIHAQDDPGDIILATLT